LISRHVADLHCDSLRKQIYKTSEILANKQQISVTDVELSSTLTVGTIPILDRLDVPELPFDDAFVYSDQLDPQRLQLTAQRRWQRIPGPAQFAINLMAYADATIGNCPLCGHEEGEQSSDEEEKALIKSFVPDQIVLSCSLSETIEN
jgi:hypothetical protein